MDIVDTLRHNAPISREHYMHRAADEIERLRKENAELLAAAEAIEINSDECLDFDECPARLVRIDDYHELIEAIARVKGAE